MNNTAFTSIHIVLMQFACKSILNWAITVSFSIFCRFYPVNVKLSRRELLLIVGLELGISGVRNYSSANCATTTDLFGPLLFHHHWSHQWPELSETDFLKPDRFVTSCNNSNSNNINSSNSSNKPVSDFFSLPDAEKKHRHNKNYSEQIRSIQICVTSFCVGHRQT